MAAPWVALLSAQPSPQIRFDGAAFRVTGWAIPPRQSEEGWESVFAVYAGSSPGAPPLLGTYNVDDGALIFTPRFPITVKVRAVFRAPGAAPVEAVFTPAVSETKPITKVEHVYPSADLLPANLLRFYLQFSGPMRRGDAWKHIRLLDRSDKPLELPFLELDQELWDAQGKRLTVLFDPGRIKRGVLPRDEEGTSLTEGSSYTLVIAAYWRDQHGAPLVTDYRKHFRVTPEARKAIDLKDWRFQPPKPGTGEALVVDFPAPLDYALLHRLIEVHGVDGRLSGTVTVTRQETQWRFAPQTPWRSGVYKLQVDTALEDVAGNRVGKPFDVDVFEPITTRITRKVESIPFRVRS